MNAMTWPNSPTDSMSLARFSTIVVLVLAVILGMMKVLNSASTIVPLGNTVTWDQQRVGERYYVGLLTADRQPHTLDIDSIAPRTRTNTNASDVRVMVCEGGMVGAASDESIHQTCHRVLPLRPGKITLSPTRTIMLEAVPHRRGQLVVDGSDVSYRDGWRRGSYPAGVFIEMKTTTG